MFRQRREERDDAAERFGKARAEQGTVSPQTASVETLRGTWERMTTRDRRELLGLRFDCVALRRDPVVAVVYPHGTGPADLPRRGFKFAPVLAPLADAPDGARILVL